MDGFEECSAKFMAWLRAKEGVYINPNVELKDFRYRGAGRGLQAFQEIEEGEDLFWIPHDDALNVHTSDIHTELPDIKKLESWAALMVTMVYEHGKGGASKWKPYFDVLPERFNTLVYWTETELKELEGSAILDKIGAEKIEQLIDDTILPLVTEHHAKFGSHAADFSGSRPREALVPLVNRMGTLVMAYAFDVERPENEYGPDEDGYITDDNEDMEDESEDHVMAMVPLADMLNADGDEKNNARLEFRPDGLHMVAIKDIARGDECFNDYGPVPRSDLLRRYGYTSDEYKIHDVVEIGGTLVSRVAQAGLGLSESEFKARFEPLRKPMDKILKKQLGGLGDDESRFLGDGYVMPSIYNAPSDLDYWDPGLTLTVEVLAADIADPNELVTYIKEQVKEAPMEPTTNRSKELMTAIIEARQKEYPTTIAEDNTLLSDMSLPIRRRQAIEVRLGEKELLAKAAESLQTNENALHGMERIAKRIKT